MAEERIKNRLDELLQKGETVLSTRHSPPGGVVAPDYVEQALFHEWRAGALSFLKWVFGENSTHFQSFQERCNFTYHSDAVTGQSILKAAKEDIEGGYLKELESLVAADVFTDFIEMAEYLAQEGYKDPAASLAGAVLEDGLRKIAKKHGITIKTREDIGSLNQKLAGSTIYNKITQKQVQYWNDIRNSADHGNFSEYTPEMVKKMIADVRDFLVRYL